MTFLRNTSINKILANFHNQKIYNGSLPTNSQDCIAVEFYSSPIINSINYSERPYLYTSVKTKKQLKGSLTIEASICIPIFLLVSYALITIISVLYLQLSIQIALEETARSTSKSIYISSLFFSQNEDVQKHISEQEPSITTNLTVSYFSSSLFRNAFINDETKDLVNSPLIKNGEKGLTFYSTSIDIKAGTADIVVKYQVNLPFIPEKIFHFNLSNRCYIHLYTGRELAKKQTTAESYVYYTLQGTVYHFNRYCQYLLDYTEAINYNSKDPIIQACKECVEITKYELETQNPIVYIPRSRRCFHTSLKCPGFTGSVYRTLYSTLKEYDKICEKCLEGK